MKRAYGRFDGDSLLSVDGDVSGLEEYTQEPSTNSTLISWGYISFGVFYCCTRAVGDRPVNSDVIFVVVCMVVVLLQ